MGTCDRTTGVCQCRSGFGGPACDTLLCPIGQSHSFDGLGTMTPCSGNGECVSLRTAAAKQDYVNFYNSTVYTDWDADMIYGCACQAGWQGVACDKRSCPKGVDPLVPGFNEVQLIDCKAAQPCTGGIYLSFRNQETALIPCDASRQLVRLRLQQLSTLKKVSVQFTKGTTLCSSGGSVLRVEFREPRGDVETMKIRSDGTLVSTKLRVVSSGRFSTVDVNQNASDGTNAFTECSSRGDCNYATGTCACYPGFRSSNGAGLSGSRGDCSFQISVNQTYEFRPHTAPYVNNFSYPNYWQGIVPKTAYSTCPFTTSGGVCNGKGKCVASTSTCLCNAGWEGPRCDRISCGLAPAWFGDVGSAHSHYATCAGVGDCDYTSGLCVNCGGSWAVFGGSKCQYLTCPANATTGAVCNGVGQCLSMRKLPQFAYNDTKETLPFTYSSSSDWDKDSIFGCSCPRSPTVDNFFSDWYQSGTLTSADDSPSTLFYRGPYANAVSDFSGYMCESARCPRGDNPATRNDQNDVQSIVCTATNGTFTLTFRANTTASLPSNISAESLEYELQLLYTIRRVSVALVVDPATTSALPDRVCDPYGRITALVEFQSEFGDLPLLKANTQRLLRNSTTAAPGSIVISKYQRGTKEDIECSGQGVCDDTVGVCKCFPPYSSSNGSVWSPGGTGDCSFRNNYDGF